MCNTWAWCEPYWDSSRELLCWVKARTSNVRSGALHTTISDSGITWTSIPHGIFFIYYYCTRLLVPSDEKNISFRCYVRWWLSVSQFSQQAVPFLVFCANLTRFPFSSVFCFANFLLTFYQYIVDNRWMYCWRVLDQYIWYIAVCPYQGIIYW